MKSSDRAGRGMAAIGKALLLAGFLGLAGCIGSGNYGWDLGGEPDPETGAHMPQAWRGVHGGRIGFRCRRGEVLLFVESWHPLRVPPGQRVPMEVFYLFDVANGTRESIQGMATARGVEIPAGQVGDGAPNTLLQGLTNDADELLVMLEGGRHSVSILFDIEDAGHAHRHVAGQCGPGAPAS